MLHREILFLEGRSVVFSEERENAWTYFVYASLCHPARDAGRADVRGHVATAAPLLKQRLHALERALSTSRQPTQVLYIQNCKAHTEIARF